MDRYYYVSLVDKHNGEDTPIVRKIKATTESEAKNKFISLIEKDKIGLLYLNDNSYKIQIDLPIILKK